MILFYHFFCDCQPIFKIFFKNYCEIFVNSAKNPPRTAVQGGFYIILTFQGLRLRLIRTRSRYKRRFS